MKKILSSILILFVLAGCSPTFPLVTDTRTSTPAPTATATLEATATPECLIKGTMASHIYHLPGQTTYKRTKVLAERGDKWFCTEQEATEAGFRKAIR